MTSAVYALHRMRKQIGRICAPLTHANLVRIVVAAALAFSTVSVVSGSQASASGGGDGCNPGRSDNYLSYYFDGAYSTPGKTMGGVYANIRNYSPYVYASSKGTDFTSEWVMLLPTSNPNLYTQVGWHEFTGGNRSVWDEYSVSQSEFHDDYWFTYPVNSTYTYDMLWNSDYGFTFEADNSVVQTYPNYFTPNEAQVYNELHTQASQIAGGYNNGNSVTDMHGYVSGGWYNFNGDSNTSPKTSWAGETPWFQSGVNSFTTWDHACPN